MRRQLFSFVGAVEVLDTTTGQRRTHHNARGTMASRADVEAF